jgi:hypothetical protein
MLKILLLPSRIFGFSGPATKRGSPANAICARWRRHRPRRNVRELRVRGLTPTCGDRGFESLQQRVRTKGPESYCSWELLCLEVYSDFCSAFQVFMRTKCTDGNTQCPLKQSRSSVVVHRAGDVPGLCRGDKSRPAQSRFSAEQASLAAISWRCFFKVTQRCAWPCDIPRFKVLLELLQHGAIGIEQPSAQLLDKRCASNIRVSAGPERSLD